MFPLSLTNHRALGACQQAASSNRSPCTQESTNGYGTCSAATFRSYYDYSVTRTCTSYAQTVTGVTPGTNNWAPQPWWVPGPRIPAIVSPGSVIGGAIGSTVGGTIDSGIGGAIGNAVGTRIGNAVDRAAVNVVSSLLGRRLLREQQQPVLLTLKTE